MDDVISEIENSKVKKFRIVNRHETLSDERLSEKLSGEVSDLPDCSADDCRAIIENHRPMFSNGLEKWL
jgi:hypothetical protein